MAERGEILTDAEPETPPQPRINSVKSTQKITSADEDGPPPPSCACAQAHAEAAQPYADRMSRMLRALAASMAGARRR